MAVAASAKRYAQAVFQIAEEQNSFDQWELDLDALAALAQDPGFRLLMESPRIPLEEKTRVLREQIPQAGSLLVQLVQLLITKHRVDGITGVAQTYREMLDERRGVVHVRVTTAVPLPAGEQEKMQAQLGQRLGKQVHLTAQVDPSILAGAILRLGGKLVDGSARSQLDALRRLLAMGQA